MRAVAQVVLNRVRHPSWPNSVCGVVYQGPMRAGGGCQFTFTCDGALARTPVPTLWARSRQYAAEALAGRTYAPVGLSTFYHANYVFPSWAPRLVKTATIGAHIFYRLPGLAGAPGSFSDAYTGSEPVVRGSSYMARASRGAAMPAASFAEAPAFNPAPGSQAPVRAPTPVPSDIPQDPRWTASNVPASSVREEYSAVRPVAHRRPGRDLGQPLVDPGQPGGELRQPRHPRQPEHQFPPDRRLGHVAERFGDGDRSLRPGREGALISGRAVAVQAGMGGRRAARQRHRDAVAGEAGDHRRLVAEPEQPRLRPRGRASHKARRRSPPSPLGTTPPSRSASRGASCISSASRASRPPAMRACATERQRLAAPSSCRSRPA